LRQGKLIARDARMAVWDRFLENSRCPGDALLASPLPERPNGLSDYFRWVLAFHPLAVPDLQAGGNAWERPLGVRFAQDSTFLDFLEAGRWQVVDVDGVVRTIEPGFGHVCNGGDWFYWPANGGRLRVLADQPEGVDPKVFAQAVRCGDNATIADLIDVKAAGALCIEGRAAATVLPSLLWGADIGLAMMAGPFVLQTALFRAHEEIWPILHSTGLSWHDLTIVLPKLTNRNGPGGGFSVSLGNVKVGSPSRNSRLQVAPSNEFSQLARRRLNSRCRSWTRGDRRSTN
jgi:hypothetical protein